MIGLLCRFPKRHFLFSGTFQQRGAAQRLLALLLGAALTAGLQVRVCADDGPAATPPKDDVVVVVTASRLEQPKRTVSSDITVITRPQIERLDADTVADALRTVPDLQFRDYGPIGSLSTIGIRGTTPEEVVVMVDGRRINPGQGGGVDLADMPLHFVDHIEVLRGGASALYGADAMGGVINIITRRAGEGTALKSTAEAGSFGYYRGTTTLTTSHDGVSLLYGFDNVATDNDFSFTNPTGAEQTQRNSAYHASDHFLKLEGPDGANSTLTMTARYYDGDKEVPGTIQFPSPQATQQDRRAEFDVVRHTALSANTSLQLRAFHSRVQRVFFDPTAFPAPIFGRHINYMNGLEALVSTQRRHWKWTTGWDHRRDKIDSTSDGAHGRTTDGWYVQGQWTGGAWTLIPGARFDSTSDYGSAFSPSFGAVRRLSAKTTLKANLTRSFRAPTFDDLYWPEDAFSKGNPNLQPERGTGADLQLNHSLRSGSVELTLFHQRATNLILWQPGAFGKWSPQNIGRARMQGVELSYTHLFNERFTGSLSYTYLDAVDQSGLPNQDGMQLIGRPQHAGSAVLSYYSGRARYNLVGRFTGKSYTTAANTQSLPSYFTVDFNVSVPIWHGIALRGEVRNLFDKQRQSISDYPLPGREIRLSLSSAR